MKWFWRNLPIIMIPPMLLILVGAAIVFYRFMKGESGVDTAVAMLAACLVGLGLCVSVISTYVAIKSLEISNHSLELTALEMQIRVRPFVSIAEIRPVVSPEKVQDPPVSACYVIVQNTGTVAASNLYLHASFRHSDEKEIPAEIRSNIPLLAPNGQHTFSFRGIPKEIRMNLYNGKIHFVILLRYAALGHNYETMQTYRTERSPEPVVQGTSPILFRPIEPSYYS